MNIDQASSIISDSPMGAHPTIPILSSSRMISVYDSHPTCDQDIRHFLPYDPCSYGGTVGRRIRLWIPIRLRIPIRLCVSIRLRFPIHEPLLSALFSRDGLGDESRNRLGRLSETGIHDAIRLLDATLQILLDSMRQYWRITECYRN